MRANRKFLNRDLAFWANVRAISETAGYTERRASNVKIPSLSEMVDTMAGRGLAADHLHNRAGKPTPLGKALQEYFRHRSHILNNSVKPNLMDASQAKKEFQRLRRNLKPSKACPLPMNKQKGEKRAPAFLTCMVNMIVEANSKGLECDYDPRSLTTITRKRKPLRTLARRVDGAFPSTVNPVAIWEIKEYYYTTTFGSRVADAVYETILDGMELSELRQHEQINVLHYLMLDARYTWWECGRSYLCRLIDAMHMGYIDEILVGREIIHRLPSRVRKWTKLQKTRTGS